MWTCISYMSNSIPSLSDTYEIHQEEQRLLGFYWMLHTAVQPRVVQQVRGELNLQMCLPRLCMWLWKMATWPLGHSTEASVSWMIGWGEELVQARTAFRVQQPPFFISDIVPWSLRGLRVHIMRLQGIDWWCIWNQYGTSDLVLGCSRIQFSVRSFWQTAWNIIIGKDLRRLKLDLVRNVIDWNRYHISVRVCESMRGFVCKMPWAHSQFITDYNPITFS